MTFTVKLLLLAALIACLVLITASTFLTPVSNDAGAYLTIADGWLAGKLPYRDLFDHKTPGIYALYALILALSGRSLVAVQLIQLAGQIACAGLVMWLAWRWWSRLAGALAGLLMLYGSAAFAGPHLTTEAWVAVCLAAGLAALLWQTERPPVQWQWLAAGFCVGLATLFKQTGAFTLAAFALWAWLYGSGWRATVRRWLWLLAGCVLPIAVMAAYFAANGALDDLWRDAIGVNLTNYPRLAFDALLRGNFVNLRSFPLLWLGVLLALIFVRPRLGRSNQFDTATLLWLTLLTGLLPLVHRPYGHYVLQALPPATILAGAGLASAWQWLRQRVAAGEDMDARFRGHDDDLLAPHRRSRWSGVILAVVLAGVIALALIDLPRWPRYLAYTGGLVRTQDRAAAAVERATQPDEPILVVTDAPQIYFLSNRQPATRWQYLLPVNYTPEREAELAAMITGHTVRTVVTDSADQYWNADLKNVAKRACTFLESFDDRFSLYNCS
ncbi:MAG: glycosyltransferase family 39 protein [Caldilineae bacterium]|nr:glycosyltransferase family 39 protein [Anaerolineae bacterium]MCB9153347.1 glycosyltransferase family 39 protein [Caldilineae bacterium]